MRFVFLQRYLNNLNYQHLLKLTLDFIRLVIFCRIPLPHLKDHRYIHKQH
jgi:hypothetical protein